MGIIDPDRVGVIGHSYGGYSVLALIVTTTLLREANASRLASVCKAADSHISAGIAIGISDRLNPYFFERSPEI